MNVKEFVFGGDRWVHIQMMANEVWVHPQSFIEAPCKHIDIPSKETN